MPVCQLGLGSPQDGGIYLLVRETIYHIWRVTTWQTGMKYIPGQETTRD